MRLFFLLHPRFQTLSTQFHSALDATNALNEFFPLMYDGFESQLMKSFYDNLDLQGKDYHIFDLVGFVAEMRLKNIRNNKDEFAGFKDPEMVKKILPLSTYKLHLERSPDFLREMSLVFIVSTFYSYLLDMCKEILLENSHLFEIMPNDEELTHFSQEIISGGVHEMGRKLKQVFGLELSANNDWSDFCEVFLRRNIFVHNDGIPTQRYIATYHVSSDRLTVNREYTRDSINILKKYQHQIENFFYQELY